MTVTKATNSSGAEEPAFATAGQRPQRRWQKVLAVAALELVTLAVGASALGWGDSSTEISALEAEFQLMAMRLDNQSARLNQYADRVVGDEPGLDAAAEGRPDEIEAGNTRLDDLESDLDLAFYVLDELSFRQETLEARVGVDVGWQPIEERLEQSVVTVETDYAQGSGFRIQMLAGCVDDDCSLYEAEGYDQVIVTNWHVISELTELEYPDRIVYLTGSDGTFVEGRVSNWDAANDLALIHIDGSDFEPGLEALEWALTEPRITDPVAIGGHPLGWDFTVTTGELSGKEGREWLSLYATISGGSSGSPVVDTTGRVIGVATASNGPTTWIVEIEALCDRLLDC